MKWANLYFFGYVVLLAGIVAALWKVASGTGLSLPDAGGAAW